MHILWPHMYADAPFLHTDIFEIWFAERLHGKAICVYIDMWHQCIYKWYMLPVAWLDSTYPLADRTFEYSEMLFSELLNLISMNLCGFGSRWNVLAASILN